MTWQYVNILLKFATFFNVHCFCLSGSLVNIAVDVFFFSLLCLCQ